MANYNVTLASSRSAEENFDYLADFSNAPDWDPNTTSSKRLNDGPLGVGDEYEVVTEFGGREMTLTYKTVEFDRPNKVVLDSGTGMAGLRDTMTFKSAGSGSEVTYDANIQMKSVAKLLDPVFTLVFKRVGDRAADSLRKKLDAK